MHDIIKDIPLIDLVADEDLLTASVDPKHLVNQLLCAFVRVSLLME